MALFSKRLIALFAASTVKANRWLMVPSAKAAKLKADFTSHGR